MSGRFIWRFGANFCPSSAINQLEMWQADTFDPAGIDRELGFAQSIGMSAMRIFLHDLAFEQDPEGFLNRVNQCLSLAEKHKIVVMPVFFDDCWKSEFRIGPQPSPRPYTHNSGWIQSPGNAIADQPESWPRLQHYVQTVLKRFRDDPRIWMWNLYNEPGNGTFGDHLSGNQQQRINRSLPLLKAIFSWSKEIRPGQPLTAAIWNHSEKFSDINRFLDEQSEVLSFHCYQPPEGFCRIIDQMKTIANGRPIVCSEYMARTIGNTFAACLPLLRNADISAINWGLVSGKTQTIYPWRWSEEKGIPERWFHDVFQPDGTLLYEEERKIFEQIRSV